MYVFHLYEEVERLDSFDLWVVFVAAANSAAQASVLAHIVHVETILAVLAFWEVCALFAGVEILTIGLAAERIVLAFRCVFLIELLL